MAKFAIIATIEANPGRMDELMPLLMAHRARSLKDEPGTLQFDFLAPADDKTKVLLIEVYADAAAFEAHRNGASMARYREESAGMVAKMTGTRGTLVE
jgi:quinol monooxygenase YgiN